MLGEPCRLSSWAGSNVTTVFLAVEVNLEWGVSLRFGTTGSPGDDKMSLLERCMWDEEI